MDTATPLRPRLSEKTYNLSNQQVYVVEIPQNANKHTVARAIEAQFEVKVDSVNIANIKGKAKRIVSLTGKRTKNGQGRQTDIKKAYVTLAQGNSLPFFAAIEEEDAKQAALQEKVDKAASKKSSKTKKGEK